MHVVVEAGALFGPARPRLSAGDKGENFVECLDGFSDAVCAGVGSECFAEGSFGVAGEDDSGECFFGDGDVGVAFVIAHSDVVGGAMFFDEVAFEDESFEFAIDDDGFDVADFADEAFDSCAVDG